MTSNINDKSLLCNHLPGTQQCVTCCPSNFEEGFISIRRLLEASNDDMQKQEVVLIDSLAAIIGKRK